MKKKTKRRCAKIILITMGLILIGTIIALAIGNNGNKDSKETEVVSKAESLVIETKPKNEVETEP